MTFKDIVEERQKLSDEEVIHLAAIAVEAFGTRKQPPRYLENMFSCTYREHPERWNVGYRPLFSEVQGQGHILTLKSMDGFALCIPPGVKVDDTIGGRFRMEADAIDRQLTAEETQRKAKYLHAVENAGVDEAMKRSLFVMELAVSRKRQGQGLGRALLEAIFVKARALHCDVYIQADNTTNKELYQHFGFEVIKVDKLPIYKQEDQLYACYTMIWRINHD